MIEELKTFISVVELKNFTKAGEHLNLSQPSVSTHIKNLETIFDVKLINRSVKQKSIVITDNGYKLYKRAKEIINLLDITFLDVRTDSDTLKGNLKIGASLTIGEYVLPKFLSFFSEKYPDVDVEIIIDNTASICQQIKKLTLDIGLIEGPPIYGNINQSFFLKDQMVLAFPKTLEKTDAMEKLSNKKWIVREEGSGTREYLNMFLSLNNIAPEKIMVLGSNYAIKEAVKNNLGVTIISNLVVENSAKNNELSIEKLDERFSRSFSYLTPKNITLSRASEVFLQELTEFYNIEK